MRLFKATYIRDNKTETAECFAEQIEGGVFRYNSFFPACEILKVEEVPQELVAAQDAYFAQFGTSAEF